MTDEKLTNLELVKINLGITTNKRDDQLSFILKSVEDELENGKGISLDTYEAKSFVVDYTAWRFQNRGQSQLPINLIYRMRNLQIKRFSRNKKQG